MDFHIYTPKGSGLVMTTHRDEDDNTPLQLISAQRLARLEQREAELEAMMERLMGEPLEFTEIQL